jgi:CheY-like chemotaxis protein
MEDLEGKVPQIEGNFTALSLVSLIQGISNNRKMLITLYSNDGNDGRLYFDNSNIVGAFVGGSQNGKKAFFRMIEWEDARFQAYDIDEISKDRYNIDLDVSHLLLEGLRQKDEKNKIKESVLPIYKIKRADGTFDMIDKERELWDIIPSHGIFINTLVNRTSMTDWEAYATLSDLMRKKALHFMKIKTMVIDDSEFMTRILEDILKKIYKDMMLIKTFQTGAEAIKVITSPDKKNKPDVIFTDIMMEGTSGMEVIKAARNQDPPIGVIAVTSLQREMKDILDAGANYLHKNWITKDNVGEIVEDLLERTICGELTVIGGEAGE